MLPPGTGAQFKKKVQELVEKDPLAREQIAHVREKNMTFQERAIIAAFRLLATLLGKGKEFDAFHQRRLRMTGGEKEVEDRENWKRDKEMIDKDLG
jgi:hypothetical protein